MFVKPIVPFEFSSSVELIAAHHAQAHAPGDAVLTMWLHKLDWRIRHDIVCAKVDEVGESICDLRELVASESRPKKRRTAAPADDEGFGDDDDDVPGEIEDAADAVVFDPDVAARLARVLYRRAFGDGGEIEDTVGDLIADDVAATGQAEVDKKEATEVDKAINKNRKRATSSKHVIELDAADAAEFEMDFDRAEADAVLSADLAAAVSDHAAASSSSAPARPYDDVVCVALVVGLWRAGALLSMEVLAARRVAMEHDQLGGGDPLEPTMSMMVLTWPDRGASCEFVKWWLLTTRKGRCVHITNDKRAKWPTEANPAFQVRDFSASEIVHPDLKLKLLHRGGVQPQIKESFLRLREMWDTALTMQAMRLLSEDTPPCPSASFSDCLWCHHTSSFTDLAPVVSDPVRKCSLCLLDWHRTCCVRLSSGSHWLDTCADMLEPDADSLPDVFKKASDSANDSDPSVADPICSLCRLWVGGGD
jgi:hypothetical protein